MYVHLQGMWSETTAFTRTAAATLTKKSVPHTDDIIFVVSVVFLERCTVHQYLLFPLLNRLRTVNRQMTYFFF